MREIISNPYIQLIAIIASIYPIIWIIIKFSKTWYEKFTSNSIKKKQKNYYKELDSDEFLEWRDFQLKKIYGDTFFTEFLGTTYPAFTIPFAEYYKYSDFKKKNVYSKDDVIQDKYNFKDGEVLFPALEETSFMNSGTPKEIKQKRKLVKDYRELLSRSIKYPQLAGFSLDHYDFNEEGEITHIYPKLGTYEYNVFSSHILEYELFIAYKKLSGAKDIPTKILWDNLPFRHYIHYGDGTINNINDVLFSGIRRYSLFSVQCIVVFKDKNSNEYKTLLMKRSTDPDKVAAKLGYYQFLPAGGFELYEKELIHSLEMIKENYSLRKAIFREYLEEVFDDNDFKAVNSTTNAETTDRILNHPQINYILDLINEGKATMNLLGVVVDLVSLRHEISFVLRVDDEKFSQESFCPNDEFTRDKSLSSKIRIPLKEAEALLCKDGHKDIIPKFNQASAILYKMFKESPFYP